jgi:microcystin degradation protein MlrC
MKSFLKKVYVKEGETGILSISPVHGFPLADVADMGSKMLVITDDDPVLAREVAEQLGMEFYETRGQISQCSDIEAALDEAQERAGRGERAVKLLEFGDLPGCGFSTDGTELLQAMIRRGMTNVAAGLIWDPQAVHICHEVGPGADLLMRIGGKASVFSGTPLDLNISVIRTYRDFVCATWIGDIALGDVAVVRSGDIELLLVSRRVLCGGMQVFRELGVEPSDKQYLVFKYIHDSDPIVAYGSTLDYKQWPFTQITRPKWPWDENPFEST